MAPPSDRKKQCILDVCGLGTIVRPVAAADCLRNTLGVVEKSHYLRDGRLQVAPSLFLQFAKPGPRGSLLIPTGHLSRAQTLLEAQGFHVSVQAYRSNPDFWARCRQLVGMADLDHDASELLRAIACFPSGLLCVRNDEGVDRAIALLCTFFSDLDVLIVTRNKRAASKAAKWLSTHVIGRVCCTWKELGLAGQPSSIFVLDVQQFSQLAPESKDFPVIIFAAAKLASGTAALSCLARLSGSFRFGCLRESDTYSDGENFTLEAIFGPPLWQQATDQVPQELFDVVFVDPPHQHATYQRIDPLARKRELIWHSATRNQFIACIAKAFASRDLAALQRLGLLVNQNPETFGRFDCSRIVVLVEVVEHARQLAKLLPSWCVLCSMDRSTDHRRLSIPALTIASQCYAQRFGPIGAEIVIRADGTQGQLAKYLRWPKRCARGLLIDLADDVDAETRRAVACHRNEYQNLGWVSSGHLRPAGPGASAQPTLLVRKGGTML